MQAVLCHVATKGFWARISDFFIPDSGPSGRRGFNDRLNVFHGAQLAEHSDFFKEEVLPDLFERVWQLILTGTDGQLRAIQSGLPEPTWKQAWWPLRATFLRLFVLAALGTLVVLVGSILALGLFELGTLNRLSLDLFTA